MTPYERLRNLITGFAAAELVGIAARLRLAERLAHGPRSVQDLAATTGLPPRNLVRLLRGLQDIGLVRQAGADTFASTPQLLCAHPGAGDSLEAMALCVSGIISGSWRHLLAGLQADEIPFVLANGEQLYSWLDGHPGHAAEWRRWMRQTDASWLPAADLLRWVKWPDEGKVVDVAGGTGEVLVKVLTRYPRLRGALVELPMVAAEAEDVIRQAGLADRITVHAGDYNNSVPAGGQVYLLVRVIFNLPDAAAVSLLRCIAAAMDQGARLIAIEPLLSPAGPRPGDGLTDLTNFALTGGRLRTRDEWLDLLAAASMELIRLGEEGYWNVLEARPAHPQ